MLPYAEIESVEAFDIMKDLGSTGITLGKLGTVGNSHDQLLRPPSITDIGSYIAAASQELDNAVALEASLRSEITTKAQKDIVSYGTAEFKNIATLWSSLREYVDRRDEESIPKALQDLLKCTHRIVVEHDKEGSYESFFPHINIYRDLYEKMLSWIEQKIITQEERDSSLLVNSLSQYLDLPLKTPQLQLMTNVISGMERGNLVKLITYLLAIEATRYQPNSENPFSGLHNLSQCLGVGTAAETAHLVSSMIASYNRARELKIEGQISFESGYRYSKLRKAVHRVLDMRHRVRAANAKLAHIQKS